jgi:hypothetical protein
MSPGVAEPKMAPVALLCAKAAPAPPMDTAKATASASLRRGGAIERFAYCMERPS